MITKFLEIIMRKPHKTTRCFVPYVTHSIIHNLEVNLLENKKK